ncbi:MAG: host attachment protein [Aestuariivirga sp.]
MKSARVWIVVADGARARVYERIGKGAAMTAIERMTLEEKHPRSSELGRDRPARVKESASPTMHGIEPGRDLHEAAEEEFIKRFSASLTAEWNKGSFDEVILVAAPRALGYLRAALPSALRKVATAEFAKDMTRSKPDEIASLIARD